MTSLFDLKDLLNPRNNLMGRWVRWLIKVENTILKKLLHWTLQWGMTTWEWSEHTCAAMKPAEIFEEKWPF